MEHVNGWCFRGIYKGGLWEDDLHVSAHKDMGSILTSYWYFVEQNEMPEWKQLWDWAFQEAYVTRDQWTYTLTRIMFAEKHHKFQCMYVSESS